MTAPGKTEPTPGNLPVELWNKIAIQLNRPKDLRTFASSCPFFREIAHPLTNTLRSDPIRVFARNYYTTLSQKICADGSLVRKILRIKEAAITAAGIAIVVAGTLALTRGGDRAAALAGAGVLVGASAKAFAGAGEEAGILAGAVAVAAAAAGIATGAVAVALEAGAAVAETAAGVVALSGAGVLAGVLEGTRTVGVAAAGAAGAIALALGVAGAVALSEEGEEAGVLAGAFAGAAGAIAVAVIAAGVAEKIALLWEEKRRYLESCSENHAWRSLARAVIREDLSFLPPTESFRAARCAYQSPSPARTLRFSRALVEQLVRSSSAVTNLQGFLPPHFKSKINQLRLEYDKLYQSEKRTFSLHREPSALEGDSITIQNLALDGRELANEIASNLSPQIVQMIDECAKGL